MNKSMNEVLVRTIVKKAIRNLKIDPERTIRNLVDMAVQFADSRFQQEFYSCAQRILSNEHSGYYTLAKDSLSQVNEETLLNSSMNLGYNGLYLGAKKYPGVPAAGGVSHPLDHLSDRYAGYSVRSAPRADLPGREAGDPYLAAVFQPWDL